MISAMRQKRRSRYHYHPDSSLLVWAKNDSEKTLETRDVIYLIILCTTILAAGRNFQILKMFEKAEPQNSSTYSQNQGIDV